MPWAQVNASDLYYQEAGQGQPLVLLHGMSSCAEAWFQQFDAFTPHFRVIETAAEYNDVVADFLTGLSLMAAR